jgi:hypothetical protein
MAHQPHFQVRNADAFALLTGPMVPFQGGLTPLS